jgi:hypothetical protein
MVPSRDKPELRRFSSSKASRSPGSVLLTAYQVLDLPQEAFVLLTSAQLAYLHLAVWSGVDDERNVVPGEG